MKYSDVLFTVTDKVLYSISNKINDLRLVTKTKYAIHHTLITTIGLKENSNSSTFLSLITLDDLFR